MERQIKTNNALLVCKNLHI